MIVGGSFSGTFPGPVPLSTTNFAAFALKLEADGRFVWLHSVDSANDQSAWAVATDSLGNVFLGGYMQSAEDQGPVRAFLTKLAP